MPQQTINIGAAPDDGTGDTLRVGGDKINDNFTELYAADAALGTAAALDVDTDDTLAADSDSLIPTQQAVKAYVDNEIAGVGGGGINVEDEGVSEATGATTLNFIGANVSAVDAGGGVVDITVSGGGSGIDVEDEGVSEATGVTTLNFIGANVSAADAGGGVVDVTVSGGSGDYEFIGRTTVTTLSAVDIALPDTHDSFHIEFYFTPSADQIGLNGAITDDNFATVESGATDYYYTRLAHTATSTGVVSSNGTTAISILGTSSIGNAANEYCDGSIQVFNAKETAPTHIRIDISWVTGTTTYGSTRCMAAYKQTGSVNGLRITPTSGTLTGFYKVWGRTA